MGKKHFKNSDSLQAVRDVINEANEALKDKTRTIAKSRIPEALAGAIGAGAGGAISFAALFYGGTTVGLSAAGISSGLAAAGHIVGGGMLAGIFVMAAPIVILGVAAYGGTAAYKQKKLNEEKESLYNLALQKHQAIINELQNKVGKSKDRIQYLEAINILLQKAIHDLKEDLRK